MGRFRQPDGHRISETRESVTTRGATTGTFLDPVVAHHHPHERVDEHHRDVHAHQPEAVPPDQPSRSVMIDIGGSVGALVLTADSERSGLEVEIHPVDDPGGKTHVWVLPREAGGAVTHAAIFPSLLEGDYVVLGPTGLPGFTVRVVGGVVTTARWA